MKTNRPNLTLLEESPDKTNLDILREDSLKTLQEIGAAVSLSATNCWSRIRKLESSGRDRATQSSSTRPS